MTSLRTLGHGFTQFWAPGGITYPDYGLGFSEFNDELELRVSGQGKRAAVEAGDGLRKCSYSFRDPNNKESHYF